MKGKAMKYETPELTTLTPAIIAIQGTGAKVLCTQGDGGTQPGGLNESIGAYADWE